MKKALVLMLMALAFMALFPLSGAVAENEEQSREGIFRFPSALTEIGEEAFEDTAASVIVFSDRLERIGDRAFSGMESLTDVYIPPSVEAIADAAFSPSPALLIHGAGGSYAQKWAKEHRIAFVVDNIWKHILDHDGTSGGRAATGEVRYRTVNPQKSVRRIPESVNDRESMRPQDRPELNPIDYRFP